MEKENSILDRLNHMQVIKRQWKLTYKEHEELGEIINTAETVIVKIGAFILIKSFSEARELWDGMGAQEVHNIKNSSLLSICKLWDKNKPKIVLGTTKDQE